MSDEVQLFDGGSIQASNDAAAVARATQEIQAALVIAQRVGRDEVKVEARILKACERRELAEVAEYEYSRGGTKITGATIDLLRACANRWGNIRYGWSEVERRTGPDGVGASSVRCFAWDLYTNSQSERTFVVKHWRDTSGGGYKLEDERDIYEAMANQASRRVRACLEEVIDADVVAKAVEKCRETLRKSEGVKSLKDIAVAMVQAFAELNVTQEMIEKRLGNKMDSVSYNQIASLRRVFKSLKDGVGTREDYFKPETAKPEFAGAGAGKTPEGSGSSSAAVEQSDAAAKPNPSPGAVVGASPAPASADDGDLAPQPKAVEPPNTLRALRDLLRVAKIKEGKLLEHLAANGDTDGSHGSLEELQLHAPSIVKGVVEKFASIAESIKARG